MRLLLTGAFPFTDKQRRMLENISSELIFVQNERETLELDVSNIDAVVCNSLFLHNDIREFTNLGLIQLTSAGLDRVPVEYINKKGIQLYNAKGVYSIPMAEWVVLKILEIYKKSRSFYTAQHECRWEKQRELLELTNKTVAIVGFGNVGEEVAKRLKAFGVSLIGLGRRPIQTNLLDEYLTVEALDDVLGRSDVVILSLPLNEQTYHLINRKRIAKMKDDSVLINVSRGKIIDEPALIEALHEGKFRGVALDVFDEEPLPSTSYLWNCERCIVTPHNSFVSDKVNERLFELIYNNLKGSTRRCPEL